MPAKRNRVSILLVLILSSLVCLCIVWLTSGFILGWPSMIRQLGEPSTGLGTTERVYLTVYLALHQKDLDSSAGDPAQEIEILVEEGESASVVVERLQAVGLVHNAELLRNYLRYRGIDREIEIGRYPLSGSMSIRQLAEQLRAAETLEIRVTIPEGWRKEQIASQIAADFPDLTEEALLAVMASRPMGYFFSDFVPENASCEGFLFPDTYSFDPESSAEEVVAAMLTNFDARLTEELVIGFLAQEISIYDAVTLASIVEREAVLNDERPLIAAVFLNRLELGMKLETDPTVQYALGQQEDGTWWKQALSYDDLAFVSPYNTYEITGLPPGPISNPGLESLQAVANPEETPFLYFRARCDGSGRHSFATTYEEHLQNACP
ncbi:MAG: endolytic transglycosylase MltG [Anaerolineales bacterium]|nr:endolytic transglycosylase MltG [Anaerolineales bacterium]